MTASVLVREDVSDLEKEIFVDGLLQPMPYAFYQQFTRNKLMNLMHKHALYCLPTDELLDYIESNLFGKVIEIGSGHGQLGRAFEDVPLTDNKMQTWPNIIAEYNALQQTLITYPDDIEELDGLKATRKYQPNTVIASFVTQLYKPGITKDGNAWGVDESMLLQLVDRYILVGNLDTHGNKEILKRKHTDKAAPWIICRATYPEKNRVFIWKR